MRGVGVAPGWVETGASVHPVERLASQNGTDYKTAEKSLVPWLRGNRSAVMQNNQLTKAF